MNSILFFEIIFTGLSLVFWLFGCVLCKDHCAA